MTVVHDVVRTSLLTRNQSTADRQVDRSITRSLREHLALWERTWLEREILAACSRLRPLPVYLPEAQRACSGERTMNRRFGKGVDRSRSCGPPDCGSCPKAVAGG